MASSTSSPAVSCICKLAFKVQRPRALRPRAALELNSLSLRLFGCRVLGVQVYCMAWSTLDQASRGELEAKLP